jgi:hypothetical protein
MGTNPDVTDRMGKRFLLSVAATMVIAASLFVIRPPEIRPLPIPAAVRELAGRLLHHPTEVQAATALSEAALDSAMNGRLALWRAAFGHASVLAPESPDPPNAFARAAFFHWPELPAADQRAVLVAYGPLLRDPATFARMAKPLFELTGNLTILERWHPPTEEGLGTLIWLALPNGFFADYRQLRAELQRKRIDDFAAIRHSATPSELIAHFPDPPYHADSESLIQALLDELHRRPLIENPNRAGVIDGIVDYALRHGLQPLDGLGVITREAGSASPETRAGLARQLGLSKLAQQIEMEANDPRNVHVRESDWEGLCEKDVCNRAWRSIEAAHGIALTVERVQSDNVPPYVEIYADDALRAEGEVDTKKDFVVPVGNAGPHRIEVVLANGTTRNLLQRRIHIARVTTL